MARHLTIVPSNLSRAGYGVPSDALGDDGDLYVNLVTGRTYQRLAGTYIIVPNDTAVGDITPVVNGQFVKGVGGVAVWSALSNTDVGLPKITTSTFAGGPPAAPADKDIWIATGVSGVERWEFQYDISEVTASKWKFLGGNEQIISVAFTEAATGAYVDLTTIGPQSTIIRTGVYQTEFGFFCQNPGNSGGGNASALLYQNAAAFGIGAFADITTINGASYSPMTKNIPFAFNAGDVIRMKYASSNGLSINFANRWLSIIPVRVS